MRHCVRALWICAAGTLPGLATLAARAADGERLVFDLGSAPFASPAARANSGAAAMLAPPVHPSGSWHLGASQPPVLGIVELPPEGLASGLQRKHHALRLSAGAAQRLLNSIGMPATDCEFRLRLPTRIVQGSRGVQAKVRAQALFGCGF